MSSNINTDNDLTVTIYERFLGTIESIAQSFASADYNLEEGKAVVGAFN